MGRQIKVQSDDQSALEGSELRVVVINDVSNVRGGATGLSITLMKCLRQRGIPVAFLCGDEGDAPELQTAGVKIFPMGGEHILRQNRARALVDGLFNQTARSHISNWIEAHDTEHTVYHLHGWSKILSPSIFAALKPVAARLIVHAHDFFLSCPNGGYANFQQQEPCPLSPLSFACVTTNCDKRSYPHKLWRAARHAVRSFLFNFDRHPARIAVIHEGMIEGLVRSGISEASITVIRNPVTPFLDRRVPAETNKKVVFAGRLFREKGADLAAAACLQANAPFMVIGEGDDEDLVRQANPNAEFLGWKQRGEIEGLMAQARLLVMPSRYPEPFGLVALEALSSGVPVILSEAALLSSEIVERKMGVAVNPADTEAFSHIIRQLLADDAKVSAMSEIAYAGSTAIYLTLEDWVDRNLDLYKRAIALPH
ncbi:MAG: glycosyltransferase family 4 protein [Pseudomonadota bacterium]